METIQLLLVEDDRDVRAVLKELFTEEGYQVAVAANGQEALDRLAHQPVQVMMTDLDMLVMDGYQLIESLSAWSPWVPHPAVIIYSGQAPRSEQIPRYLEQGAIAAVLTKPTKLAELLATVSRAALQATALSLAGALAS